MINNSSFSACNASQPSISLYTRLMVPGEEAPSAQEQEIPLLDSDPMLETFTSAEPSGLQAANDNAVPAGKKAVKGEEKKEPPEAGTTEDACSADAMTGPAGTTSGKKSHRVVCIPILHTNDIHGQQEKLPALAATISALRKEEPGAILVDAGDMAYSAKEVDKPYEPIIYYLNTNNYFAVVPGNHDFQWGRDAAVNDFFKRLDPLVLCSNVLDRETGKELEGTKPFVIREVEGVKVAFFGVTTTEMQTSKHPGIGDDLIAFGEVQSLQRDVARAKGQGAQVFVAIVHKGVKDVSEIKGIAKQVPELDLIISAHDHEVQRISIRTGPFPHRTYIVEAGCYGNYVGGVTLLYDKEKGAVVKGKMKTYPTEKYVITAGEQEAA